jgi:ribosomal protein S16
MVRIRFRRVGLKRQPSYRIVVTNQRSSRDGRFIEIIGHHNPRTQPMVDVIDDAPGERWLSVCFYGETIQDPDELGDLIPDGLLGEDGYCFDISEADDRLVSYVGQRVEEAYSYKA